MVSDTIADLLYRRIQSVDEDLKEALKLTSLIGYHFDEDILLEIAFIVMLREGRHQQSRICHSKVCSLLSMAVEEGFIEKIRDGYKFSHDKL